jgi:polyisoprenoid-binding protein YceI
MNPAIATTPTTWDIDTVHSSVGFTVRHLVISKVHGRFSRWNGTLVLDEARPEDSHVDVRIEAASIDTHEAKRDAHLCSPDFLDAAKFPELSFVSTHVEGAGQDHYRMTGNLTIRGVTRPVTLEVEMLGRGKDPWGGERTGFSAKASMNRVEFGLVWNQALEAGGVVVGEKVDIDIEIEAVLRAETAAA